MNRKSTQKEEEMERILVVDDKKEIRRIYTTLLASEGFKVIAAASAHEANEVLKNEKIDLVLLDIKMPRVGGRTLYEVIQLFHKTCKVIVTSVYPLDEQKRVISGANDYYDKSQGTDILLGKIKEALGDGAFTENSRN